MSKLSLAEAPTVDQRRETHVVHSLLHFLRMVRYRKTVVAGSLIVCLGLGALYYTSATRLYQSTAGILVTQSGSDTLSTQLTPEGARQGLMPTYERILRGSEVLEGAVKRLKPEHRVDLVDVEASKWSEKLLSNLSIKTVRQSNVIEVTYRSKDAAAAKAVVEAVVASYLEFMQRTNQGAATQILKVLNEEKADANRRLTQKQQEVLAARKQMLDVGVRKENGPLHPVVQQAITLSESLLAIKQQRIQLQATAATIQAAIRNGGDLSQHMLALEGELGREMLMATLGFNSQDATSLARLEQQILRDQAELSTMLQAFGDRHPEVQQLANRIRTTQEYLAGYQTRMQTKLDEMQGTQLGPLLTRMLEQRLSEVMRHEAALTSNYESARSQAIQLVGATRRLEILEQDEAWLRSLRDSLLEKIARIDLTQDHGNIRTEVTDRPKVSDRHVWPKLPLVGLLSLVSGLGLGLAIASVLDVLDDRFRSPDELQEQAGLPLLAMVRKMQARDAFGADALQMHVAPDSAESEAFRTLRTTLAFQGNELDTLVVSSTEPGDGKTTVLSNLAVAFAGAGKRVLLIDADMRRPGLTRMMDMRTLPGLTQILQGEGEFATAAAPLIRPTGVSGLDVIPSGPRQMNPAELLSSTRLGELLAWASSQYDHVLIDAPPAMAAADAAIISSITDGLILVVRPEKNRRQLVLRAISGFRAVGVEPLGLVLNGLGGDSAHGYYGYGYADNYGEYSQQPDDAESDISAGGLDDHQQQAA